MSTPIDQTQPGPFRQFLSRLSFPKLFLLLTGLFLVDAVIPDMIPFMDEAVLGILAVIVGSWRQRRAGSRTASADRQIR
jgi:hypothetical protein